MTNEGVLNVMAAIYKMGNDSVLEEITDELDKEVINNFLEEGCFNV